MIAQITTLLKVPKVLPLSRPSYRIDKNLALLWRRHLLLIQSAKNSDSSVVLPSLQNDQWCENCLSQSPIKAIRLDTALGEETIKQWAKAGIHSQKRVFLRLPAATCLPKNRAPWAWQFKRVADWLAAAAIALCLSPLLLLLMIAIYCDSSGPIFFTQWRVGHRGRLFRIVKFRTMRPDAERLHHQLMSEQSGLHKLENDPRVTLIGRFLRKYSLDELPQLFNVLRGEMSLVGPRPLALYDALRLCPRGQQRLNAVPGMTGFWQVKARSHQRDLNIISQLDLDYLNHWSLLQDCKLLLLTLPKVLSGFGAC